MDDQKGPIEDDKQSLPEDIISFEIFPRLPIKSLYQFRCVSKWYRYLTNHSAFLDAYHSRRRCHYLLAFQDLHWDFVFYSVEPDSSGKAWANSIDQVTNLHCSTYAKSINGLMCISKKGNVSIWQVGPYKRRSIRKLIPWFNRVQRHAQYIYFCYDPNSEKYKVLAAISTLDDVLKVQHTRYWIFTIGLDVDWREIHAPNLYHLRKGKSVCIDGILYCTNFSSSPEVDNGVIACFSVADEHFQIIPYPGGLSSSRYSSCYIIKLEGSLCVIDTENLTNSCFMTMWVYDSKAYDPQDCATWMEHRIEVPSYWQIMFNIWHNCSFCSNCDGEIVVAVSGMSTVGCCMFIYNFQRRKWRKMEILGLEGVTIMGDFLLEEYVDSPCLRSDKAEGEAEASEEYLRR